MATYARELVLLLIIFFSVINIIDSQDIKLFINEVVPSNVSILKDIDGEFCDWMELYNASNETIKLQNYYLSDQYSELNKWNFPDIQILPNSYLIIWLSGKNKSEDDQLHTNFKLKQNVESLYLSDNSKYIIDSISKIYCPANLSYGRNPENIEQWVIFDLPTPGSYNSKVGKPVLNHEITADKVSGFYKSTISVKLSVSDNGLIRYTTDGSEPDNNSILYTKPIAISKTTVIKAREFKEGYLPGFLMVNTYFIGYSSQLPVISLSSHPDNFFDEDIGIYIEGNGTAYGGYESNPIGPPANYWEDWEIPVNIEFFEPEGNRGFETKAGVKMVGKVSRQLPQKSFGVFFRNEYGNNEIEYPIFSEFPITKFKSLVFRNGGTENTSSGGVQFRDGLSALITNGIDVEKQAYRPAALFINGAYWGIYEIREKVNEDFLSSHYNVDKEEISMLDDYHTLYPLVITGDATDFNSMIDYIEGRNLFNNSYNDYVGNIMDINNFLDYMAIQIYQVNHDGPGHNCKFWRYDVQGARYRWIMYDVDQSFGFNTFVPSEDGNAYSDNTIAYYTEANGPSWPNPPESTFLMRHLLENDENRHNFINKLSDYLNSYFDPDRVIYVIDSLADALEDEMPKHLERWGGSIESWYQKVEKIRNFASNRPEHLRNFISEDLQAGNQVNITIDVIEKNSGKIKINNLIISTFPWKGTYYSNTPIEVTALPKAGYQFITWKNSELTNEQKIEFLPKKNMVITALFEKALSTENKVVITEFSNSNYSDCLVGDWIEIFNPNNFTIDISNWLLTDNNIDNQFVFPSNSLIFPQSHFVISSEKMRFKYLNHDLFLWDGGNLGFGLDNESDKIILKDAYGNLIDSVEYKVADLWPERTNKCSVFGLADYTTDNSVGQNWLFYQYPGTPGQLNNSGTISKKIEAEASSDTDFVKVYPNPAQSSFFIQTKLFDKNQNLQINIYNLNSQIFSDFTKKQISDNIWQVFIPKQGFYFIELLAGSKRYIKKVAVITKQP